MNKDIIYREDAIKAVEDVSENYTKEGDREWHPLDKRCEECIFVEGSHWCDGCDKTPKGMKEYDEYFAKAKESE